MEIYWSLFSLIQWNSLKDLFFLFIKHVTTCLNADLYDVIISDCWGLLYYSPNP